MTDTATKLVLEDQLRVHRDLVDKIQNALEEALGTTGYTVDNAVTNAMATISHEIERMEEELRILETQ
jgi:hypothetical protein